MAVLPEAIVSGKSDKDYITTKTVTKISTDSRDTFNDSTLFIAIKGEIFNGNDYAKEVYNKGCRLFVLSEAIDMPKDSLVILCGDTVLTHIKIARIYRDYFSIPFIAITGSSGKTTTKELTYLFLSSKYKTLKTEENLNNEIGVPKMIFSLDDTYESAVLEAGMNHKGELSRISICLNPDTILINNIEAVHIANLGSMENIAKAKSELFENVNTDAVVILNKDTNCLSILESEAKNHGIKNIIYYSLSDVTDITEHSFIYKNILFNHTLNGKFNVYNILASLKIAELYGVNLETCKNVLPNYKNLKNRMDIFELNSSTIINDCYNSNPNALKNMLTLLSQRKETNKIALIGDMLETETEGTSYHKEIGEYINSLKNIDTVITVGNHSKDIYKTVNSKNRFWFSKNSECIDILKTFIKEDTAILIKASLGMDFNYIIKEIQKLRD